MVADLMIGRAARMGEHLDRRTAAAMGLYSVTSLRKEWIQHNTMVPKDIPAAPATFTHLYRTAKGPERQQPGVMGVRGKFLLPDHGQRTAARATPQAVVRPSGQRRSSGAAALVGEDTVRPTAAAGGGAPPVPAFFTHRYEVARGPSPRIRHAWTAPDGSPYYLSTAGSRVRVPSSQLQFCHRGPSSADTVFSTTSTTDSSTAAESGRSTGPWVGLLLRRGGRWPQPQGGARLVVHRRALARQG